MTKSTSTAGFTAHEVPGARQRPTEIIIANVIALFVGTAFVVARLTAKLMKRGSWGRDDSMICVAWLCTAGLCGLNIAAGHLGAGLPYQYTTPDTLPPNIKINYAYWTPYQLSLSCTKLAICLFYLRVFQDRVSQWLSLGTIAFITAYTIPFVIAGIFKCWPVSSLWDVNVDGKCIDMNVLYFVSAGVNIVVDIWLIGIVVPRISPLRLPRRQKWALMFVVSMGWIVVIASISRIIKISHVLAIADKSWAVFALTIWAAVETNVGLVCVCAPAIFPLLQRMAPRFFGVVSSQRSGSHKKEGSVSTKHESWLGRLGTGVGISRSGSASGNRDRSGIESAGESSSLTPLKHKHTRSSSGPSFDITAFSRAEHRAFAEEMRKTERDLESGMQQAKVDDEEPWITKPDGWERAWFRDSEGGRSSTRLSLANTLGDFGVGEKRN